MWLSGRVVWTWLGCASERAVGRAPRLEWWWVKRHVAKVAEARRGGVDLVFLGDSITQNYEEAGPGPERVFRPVWEELFAPQGALNLGFSGDETRHVLWRIRHGELGALQPRDVVLLIGTNDTSRGREASVVAEGIEKIVDELRRRLPVTRILLLGILPSARSKSKSRNDAAVNASIQARYAGSAHVQYLDLEYLFVRDGVVDGSHFYDANGALHPNTKGQRRMAEAVAAVLFPVT